MGCSRQSTHMYSGNWRHQEASWVKVGGSPREPPVIGEPSWGAEHLWQDVDAPGDSRHRGLAGRARNNGVVKTAPCRVSACGDPLGRSVTEHCKPGSGMRESSARGEAQPLLHGARSNPVLAHSLPLAAVLGERRAGRAFRCHARHQAEEPSSNSEHSMHQHGGCAYSGGAGHASKRIPRLFSHIGWN